MKHTFKESYGVLQRHAQTLREQREPNIDDLLQIVEESVSAYKICQARIDAVEKALEKELGSEAAAGAAGLPSGTEPEAAVAASPAPRRAAKAALASASSAAPVSPPAPQPPVNDDDIPF